MKAKIFWTVSKRSAVAMTCGLLTLLAIRPSSLVAQSGLEGQAGDAGIPNASSKLDYSVDSQNGRFTYVIPITVPPARQGAQPKLQLAYNSGGGNGWCGMGWVLDIGAIERDTQSGPPISWTGGASQPQYDDTKGFVFSMGGASGRLVLTPRTDEYRLDIQVARLVIKLDRPNNRWTVTDSGGNQFYFGQVANTRMLNDRWAGTGPGQTFRWVLDRVIDANGNSTIISWQPDGGLLYPSRIDFNGHTSLPALGHPMSVVFNLESRTDGIWNYRGGFGFQQNKRLKTIQTFVESNPVATYTLNYVQSPVTGRSLLNTVIVAGFDGTALPPITFNYTQPSLEYGDLTPWNRITTTPDMPYVSANAVSHDTSYALLDLNGDGLPDRVWRDTSSGQYTWKIEANNGTSFSAAATFGSVSVAGLNLTTQEEVDYVGFGSSANHVTFEFAVDMNGDGRPDRLVCNKDRSKHYVQLNTGNGLGPLTEWTGVAGPLGLIQETVANHNTDGILLLQDMNGDGKPDRVYMEGTVCKVQFNTGTGWAAPMVWAGISDTYITRTFRTDPNAGGNVFSQDFAILIDMNADGLPDRVTSTGGTTWKVQYNRGDGFSAQIDLTATIGGYPNIWTETSPQTGQASQTKSQGLGDRNGDGIPDLQLNDDFYSNIGTTFSPTASHRNHRAVAWRASGADLQNLSVLRFDSPDFLNVVVNNLYGQSQYRDINGDGLPDLVVVLMNLSGSSAWLYADQPGYPPPSYDPQQESIFWYASQTAGSTKLFAQLTQGQLPDLLKQVISPLGGSVSVTYSPSTTFVNDDAQGIHLLPFPVYAVQQTRVNDGFGNEASTTYTYSGGYFDAATREFRGFHRVEAINPVGIHTVTYFHQGGGYDGSSLGEYQDSYAKKGLPYLVEVYGNDGSLVHRTLSKVEVTQPEAGVAYYFPFISQTINMDFADATHYRATAEQLTYDPQTGNVLVSLHLGEVGNVLAATHSLTDLDPNDNIRRETTYKALANPDIVNKPDVITISKPDLSDARKTRYSYDAAGNLTLTEGWLTPGNRWVVKGSVQYDTFGNPWRTTDAAGVVTETLYESYKTFPVVKKLAVATSKEMVTATLFDVRSGFVLRVTNHLGVIVQTDYDPLYRPTATFINEAPLAQPTLWRTKTDYLMNGISGTACNNRVHQQTYDPNDTIAGIETYTYLDGLARPIQVRLESEVPNQFRCTDRFYDDSLNSDFAPNPYFSTGSGYVANTAQQLGTLTERDSLGRALRVTPAAKLAYTASRQRNGSVLLTGGDSPDAPTAPTLTAYKDGTDPWVTVTTDADNKVTKTYNNALGRVFQIVKLLNQGSITTTYSYDLQGNLTTVIDNSNNRTDIGYDSLSRKTSIHDPDMGSWSYQYDDASRLTDQYDAKSQHVHISYESVVGRLKTKEVFDGNGVLKRRVEYLYDSALRPDCTVQLGQLGAITDTTISCNCIGNQRFWSYDYKGRVLKEGLYAWPMGTFVTTTTYNNADQAEQVSYPNDVARMLYTYQNGVLHKVQSLKGTGPTSEVFYELTGINEFGQATEYLTHNGQVKSTHEFYDNSRRLKSLSVAKGTTDILKKTYGFDTRSNVKFVTDGVAAHSGASSGTLQSIQYDELNRLTGLTDASATRAYTYDSLGNITKNEDSGSGIYTYGSSHPHAVTQANGKTYGYDANGSMINRNGQTLVYDEENRLIKVGSGSVTVHFGYDYTGARLWKYNQTTDKYTCYVSPLYEYRESDTAGLCYVYANGERIAGFRPTTDVYASGPRSWRDRWATVARSAAQRAGQGVYWMFDIRRVDLTSVGAAVVFALLVVSVLRRAAGTRLAAKERRLYWQPIWARAISFVLIPALLIATTEVHAAFVPGEVFYYYHSDHLGSANITTDRSGNVIQQYEYKAYGAERNAVNNAAGHPEYNLSYRYTGQIIDEDTGLYYYNARFYDPELGRFVQADTIVPSASDPQSLNRYSYCANNPLKYIDPSGHDLGILIGILIGALLGGVMAAINGTDIWMGMAMGALGGFYAGVGAAAGGAIGGIVAGAASGAVSAAFTGGDVWMGAITGTVSAVIGWGVTSFNKFYLQGALSDFTIGMTSSTLSGGVNAEIRGGDFWEGAKKGAIGASLRGGIAPVRGSLTRLVDKWVPPDKPKPYVNLETDLANLYKALPADAAKDGTHEWIIGVNAMIASHFGPAFAPFQWLMGFYHALDWNSWRAGETQGIFNHILHSFSDVMDNTTGILMGNLFSARSSIAIATGTEYSPPDELKKQLSRGPLNALWNSLFK